MRIVAGKWADRPLMSPGRLVRPTAEPVRIAWLDHLGERLRGARVLDLFAGTGALGLEALSRGAAAADFVEDGPTALHALKANLAALRLLTPRRGTRRGPSARIFKRDAIPFVGGLGPGAYDIAFADPPYGSRKLDRVIDRWFEARFAAILGVEHATDHVLPEGGVSRAFQSTRVTLYGLDG